MIETDPEKYKALLKTAEAYPSIKPYNETIHYNSEKGILLDDFLTSNKISDDLDLLSIDVDSCDYQIWESLTKCRPKIVIVEVNNLNLDVIYQEGAVHKKHLEGSTAFPPMKRLGESKGYTLLTYTYNMIFARNDIFEVLKNEQD